MNDLRIVTAMLIAGLNCHINEKGRRINEHMDLARLIIMATPDPEESTDD